MSVPDSVIVGCCTTISAPLITRFMFPSKVGGKPAWLVPENLPEMLCPTCSDAMAFLTQVYAPTQDGQEGAFHRTLMVFHCLSCRSVQRVVRCMIPRMNRFYSPNRLLPREVPKDDEVLSAVVCSMCGCKHDTSDVECCVLPEAGLDVCCVDLSEYNELTSSGAPQIDYTSAEYMDGVDEQMDGCSDDSDDSENEANGLDGLESACSTRAVTPVLPRRPKGQVEDEALGDDSFCGEWVDDSNFDDTEKPGDLERPDDDMPDVNPAFKKELSSKLYSAVSDHKESVVKSAKDSNFNRFLNLCTLLGEYQSHVILYGLNESPIWISDHGAKNTSEVPKCERCGSSRRFEFQIQPQMVSILNQRFLGTHSGSTYSLSPFAWGVIAIYTCSANCEAKDGECPYIEEYAYNQMEPEDWLSYSDTRMPSM